MLNIYTYSLVLSCKSCLYVDLLITSDSEWCTLGRQGNFIEVNFWFISIIASSSCLNDIGVVYSLLMDESKGGCLLLEVLDIFSNSLCISNFNSTPKVKIYIPVEYGHTNDGYTSYNLCIFFLHIFGFPQPHWEPLGINMKLTVLQFISLSSEWPEPLRSWRETLAFSSWEIRVEKKVNCTNICI